MATLDKLAPSRNWFCGDPNLPFTPLLDAYMAGSQDLSGTVDGIVKPVNENYSSGDAGQEPTTESLLWDLWYTILYSARKTPRKSQRPQHEAGDQTEDRTAAAILDPSLPSPGHQKLLSLLETLKAQTDPQPPAGKQSDDWVYRSDGKVWSVLLLFGPATREVLNDAPGTGSGYEDIELAAWENLNAFLAQVTLKEIAGLETTGVFALRHALEQQHKDDVKGKFKANEPRKVEAFMSAAGVWVVVMGEELWARKGEKGRRDSDSGVQAKGDVINKERWKLWVERLRFLSCREDLSIATRELAAQAAAIMMRVQV